MLVLHLHLSLLNHYSFMALAHEIIFSIFRFSNLCPVKSSGALGVFGLIYLFLITY